MRKKQQLVRCQSTILSSTIKASDRRVGGLVGSCVSGLVSEMAEGNWYWEPRLGIPIFGSDFWDPHRKRNSDSVFDSEDSSRIFF
jgi:hypothetical protein